MKSLLLTLASFLIATLPTHASLVSCATNANPTMCSLCDVFVTGNTIVNYFSGILLPIALVALTIGGVMYLIGKVDQAKSILLASVLGIILSLSAFLIVNITLRALSIPQTDWNTFTCAPQVAQNPSPSDKTTFNTSGEGGPKDSQGNPVNPADDPVSASPLPDCDTKTVPLTSPLKLWATCRNLDTIASYTWILPEGTEHGTQGITQKESSELTINTIPESLKAGTSIITLRVTNTQGQSKDFEYTVGGGGVATAPTTGSCSNDPNVPVVYTVDGNNPVTNFGRQYQKLTTLGKTSNPQYPSAVAIKIIVPAATDPSAAPGAPGSGGGSIKSAVIEYAGYQSGMAGDVNVSRCIGDFTSNGGDVSAGGIVYWESRYDGGTFNAGGSGTVPWLVDGAQAGQAGPYRIFTKLASPGVYYMNIRQRDCGSDGTVYPTNVCERFYTGSGTSTYQ